MVSPVNPTYVYPSPCSSPSPSPRSPALPQRAGVPRRMVQREVHKISAVERQRAEAAYAAVGAKMELLDRKKEQLKKDFLVAEK